MPRSVIIGFKTGPRNWEEGQRIVEEDGARMCEIWYRVDRKEDYVGMLKWLGARDVRAGLHYWGLYKGEVKPNLMTADKEVRAVTIGQIKETIDVGVDIGCVYVNIHPGARWLEKIDFATSEQSLVAHTETRPDEAEEHLFESLAELSEYARTRKVLLTVETLPGRESKNFEKRDDHYDPGNPPLQLMQGVGEAGFWLANDITHSAAALGVTRRTIEDLFSGLAEFTRTAADRTRLVHVNTIIPPLFTGTDSHDGLLPADFAAGVFPTRDQLRKLLAIFRDREDVYAVPEPRRDMQANYQALVRLVREL